MRPARPLKWLLRAPVAAYSMHAGWLLGHRFLLLVHRGRRTGRVHRTVLEVIAWDDIAREAVVMSGFGQTSQWYRNVLATDPVEVRIARLRFVPHVRELGADEAAGVLAAYEERNRTAAPVVRAVLSRLAGFRYDGSEAARRRLVQVLPLVAFGARDERGSVAFACQELGADAGESAGLAHGGAIAGASRAPPCATPSRPDRAPRLECTLDRGYNVNGSSTIVPG